MCVLCDKNMILLICKVIALMPDGVGANFLLRGKNEKENTR